MNDRPVAIDFETYYDAKYSVRDMIAEEYCRDSRFDAYLLSVYDGHFKWVGHPLEFDWDFLSGRVVLAHNKYFDLNVWHELYRRHPDRVKVNYGEFHCTANLTSYLCNCRALAEAAKALYGQYVSKGARSDMKGKRWSELGEYEQRALRDYALGDVEWCWRFWADHAGKWPDIERKLSNLTIDQGMRGVAINRELLGQYIQGVAEALDATAKTVPWSEDRAVSSTTALHWQCRKEGIPCPSLKSEDEEAYLEWEEAYSPGRPWISAVSAYRSLTKLRSAFGYVAKRLRDDNTLPFSLKYFGAHTGRWSGDAKINMQNPRKESVFINEQGLMEADKKRCRAAVAMKKETGEFPKWVRQEINFRHLIIPRPGKKMIVSDLSQIEPRVLFHLAGDREALGLIRTMSPYVAHARQTMGWEDGWTDENHPKEYALAKARVLGLGYGCGWKKFIKVAMTMAQLDITADDPEFEIQQVFGPDGNLRDHKVPGYGYTARKIVEDYRERSPKIVALWRRLDGELKASVGEDFEIKLPSWRSLVYRKVVRSNKPMVDEDGQPSGKWVYTADLGHIRTEFYGGKLTENVVQAVARDVFGELMLDVAQTSGMTTLFSSHDELIVEVEPFVQAADVQRLMSKTPEWLPGCPIAAKAKEVAHYIK